MDARLVPSEDTEMSEYGAPLLTRAKVNEATISGTYTRCPSYADASNLDMSAGKSYLGHKSDPPKLSAVLYSFE